MVTAVTYRLPKVGYFDSMFRNLVSCIGYAADFVPCGVQTELFLDSSV